MKELSYMSFCPIFDLLQDENISTLLGSQVMQLDGESDEPIPPTGSPADFKQIPGFQTVKAPEIPATEPQTIGYVGVPENQEPQFWTLNSRAFIMRTPIKRTPPISRNSHMD